MKKFSLVNEYMAMKKIAVIGAGSWGTALAKHLADAGHSVLLWAYETEVVEGVRRHRKNPLFLSDILLPSSLQVTSDLQEALSQVSCVVSVIPSHVLRALWKKASPLLLPNILFVSCTKGIEPKTQKLMSQVLDDVLPHHPSSLRVVLSGPSFAKEVAAGLPTSVVIAGEDRSVTEKIQHLFRTQSFLPFTSDDVIGVQVGGAVKNVIAIAAGMSDGLGLGANARAAIVTRGVYETMKVGIALGAKRLTMAGLSGLGDLVLTCTGPLSRNYSVGRALGEGKSAKEVLGEHMVAEGVVTAKAVDDVRVKHHLTLPICNAIHRILSGELKPDRAVKEITSLPLGDELSGILQEGENHEEEK